MHTDDDGWSVKDDEDIEVVNFTKDEDGAQYWFDDAHAYHREDGPAVEYPDGTKWWYINGALHRDGGPAGEYSDGTKWWYRHGELHREDGPAIEWADGTTEWYLHGRLWTEGAENDAKKKAKEKFLQEMKDTWNEGVKIRG